MVRYVFGVMLVLFAVDPLSAQQKVFRAGAFAMNINPLKYPISVNGGMSDRQAVKAFDPLHARCLVLDDGRTRIAIVVCDSCMMPREVVDEAKRLAHKATGIPVDKMLISATHTHTAPTLGGVFQSDPDPDYLRYLPGKIAEGIARANTNRAPARIGWAVGRDPTQVFNRRWKMKEGSINPDPFGNTTDRVVMNPGYRHKGLIEPAGPTDPDISVLSLQSPEGRPIALLANYSLHYVGGVRELSADYFAAFAERMGQLLDAGSVQPPFVGIMSNGTSGDINNLNFAGPAPKGQGPYEQVRLVADSVARAAFKAYQTIKHRDWVELAMAQAEIELGVRKPSAAEVERAHEILSKAPRSLRTLAEVYARETVLLSRYPSTVKAVLQAIRIGELGIAATPCETFVDIGLTIKKKSPLRPTFTIELANGYNGYLPTPEQHKLGGYETWRARSSYLEVNAATKITERVLDLLGQVSGRAQAGDTKDLPLVFEEDFAKGARRWQPTDPKAWKVVKGAPKAVYNQFRTSKYNPPFRSPLNIALIKDEVVGDFVLEASAQSTGKDGPHRDMCLFFGYQDPAHFYYVHIAKKADDHANQLFIVNGAPRKKISLTSTAGTPWDDDWHRIKIVRRVKDGDMAVYFDDMNTPIMTARDKRLTWGRIGIGSFDDSGNWSNLSLRGVRVRGKP